MTNKHTPSTTPFRKAETACLQRLCGIIGGGKSHYLGFRIFKPIQTAFRPKHCMLALSLLFKVPASDGSKCFTLN